jgi:glutamyl-tRNA synthetase
MSVKVRFAPSPTGRLHVGNVRAALFNWLFAKKQGGSFLLRSDDTDEARSTKDYEDGIIEDLGWLGISHDEFFRQSERFAEYDAVRDYLIAEGLLYPCYESAEDLDRKRKLQRARSLPPVYDRAALGLSDEERAALKAEGRKPHWRFKLSQKPVRWDDLIRGEVVVDSSAVSDPVLIREDGGYLYTLPSCVDDVDAGISHVVRGEDHVTNTATQTELFEAIIRFRGKGAIPTFAHHSLLIGADGQSLSKRLGSLSIAAMREEGLEPEAITSLLARLGTSDPVEPKLNISMLVEGFSFDRMGRAPARFDMAELEGLNAKILHEMPWQRVAERVEAMGGNEALWQAVHGNINKLGDIADWVAVVSGEIDPVIENEAVTKAAAEALPEGDISADDWGGIIEKVKAATGAKGKNLFMPLRLALTGKAHGPEMGAMLALIGREKAKARLLGQKA